MTDETSFLTFKGTRNGGSPFALVLGEVAKTIQVVSITTTGKLIMHVDDPWISGSGKASAGTITIHGDWGDSGTQSHNILQLLTLNDGSEKVPTATTDGLPPLYSERANDAATIARMARRTSITMNAGTLKFERKNVKGINLLTKIVHVDRGEWNTVSLAFPVPGIHRPSQTIREYKDFPANCGAWSLDTRRLPVQPPTPNVFRRMAGAIKMLGSTGPRRQPWEPWEKEMEDTAPGVKG